MNNENKKISLKGYTYEELINYLQTIGEPSYKGKQIFNWIYNHLAASFDEMLDLSKPLRAKLNELCTLDTLTLVDEQISKFNPTRKFLFETFDGNKIESVLIPEGERNTLCISTQAGCPLGCKFCATGLFGFKRNLTSGEIIDQYLKASKLTGKEHITNIVYMGMGEPLLNYSNTIKSLQILTCEFNKSVSRTRITVSTSGISDKIRSLADSDLRVKLALSLHSSIEETRSKLMPVNIKFPLSETLKAVKYYAHKTKTRITFEYTLIKGVNDSPAEIKGLTQIASSVPCKVNLIPFNDISHMNPDGISAALVPANKSELNAFADKLRDKNVTVMIRESQGEDIAAACGQLAAKNKEQE